MAQVSAQLGRPVSVDNINYLIDQKLAPLGVIATGNAADQDADEQAAPSLTRANPLLLGLRYRTRVVPERLHRGASRVLRPLFWPPLVLAALASFAGFDVWLVTSQGSAVMRGVEQAILHPDLLLAVIAISVAPGWNC